MATTLASLGHDVIGIDGDEDKVRAVADTVSLAMQLDATDEKALRGAGIKDVDVAVVSIGENIEASLLVVTLLREIGINRIVAKAVTALHGRILEKLGVMRVVFPEREMAIRVAHSIAIPNVLDYIELSRDFSIVEVPAPAEFVGKTLRDIGLRARFGLTTIAIKHVAKEGDRGVDQHRARTRRRDPGRRRAVAARQPRQTREARERAETRRAAEKLRLS